jgi:S1-C subfamily serine protease
MKTFLALLLVIFLLIGGYTQRSSLRHFVSLESDAIQSSGAIFTEADRTFHCSGTEIGSTKDGGGIFLTARHCVANADTNKISQKFVVSFSADEAGPFYDATPIAISLNDDLALLYLKNGANIPTIRIRDNRRLSSGDSIFNVSFPLGTGKHVFHGEYVGDYFPKLPAEILNQYPMWQSAMPMNLTIAHGSSGSGVFSQAQHALIGVAVGTFAEGSYNIAIPSERVLEFLNDLSDNTVTKFIVAHPEKDAVIDEYF